MKKLKDMLKDKMMDIRKKRKLNEIENKNKEEDQSEDEQKNTIYESAEDSEEREERVKEMELEYAKDGIDEQQDELTLFKEAGDGDSGNEQKGGGIRKKTKSIQKGDSSYDEKDDKQKKNETKKVKQNETEDEGDDEWKENTENNKYPKQEEGQLIKMIDIY
ncbi:MAG: hypothetical protein EZS28_055260, partial [Streblomastix strix]